MLLLLFRLGDDHYALDVKDVVAVVPMVALKQIPDAPPEMAGVFNYHGTPVPVIDLRPGDDGGYARANTRILVYRDRPRNGQERLVGLAAEGATTTLSRNAEDFVDPGLNAAPYLGPVTSQGSRVVQRLHVSEILSQDVRARVFRELDEAS